MTDWLPIEQAARAQVTGDLDLAELMPLEFGQSIAWTECWRGRTNGISPVHQVGFPQFDHAYTACGEIVPPPVRWIPMSPELARTMSRCRYCTVEAARIARERAA